MGVQRDLMIKGDRYQPEDQELADDRARCAGLVARYNAGESAVLPEMLGELGSGASLLPPLRVEYGYNVRIGPGTFINYESILMDCGPITIGERVQIGPRVQLLTALHPMEDHEARRAGWEWTRPI